MSIKTLVADVTAQTTDIADSAITSAKLSRGASKWITGTFSGLGTTVAFTLTTSAPVTFLTGYVVVTANASAAITIKVQSTAGVTLINAISATSARTIWEGNVTAFSSAIGALVELTSSTSLEGTLSAASADIAGKYFMHFITTPT